MQKPVALAAGLPKVGLHSFRHTLSAWGKEAGLKLEDVKTLLRHCNIARLKPHAKRAAARHAKTRAK